MARYARTVERFRVRSYQKKLVLRRCYSTKLEEQMAKLLVQKLGHGVEVGNSPSPLSAVPIKPQERIYNKSRKGQCIQF